MSRIDVAAVRTGAAAAAADMAHDRLQMKLSRGTIALTAADKESSGTGDFRLLSLRRCLAIAIAERLGRIGIRPSNAGTLAALAVGQPGSPAPAGWLVKEADRPAVVSQKPPTDGDAVVVDISRLLRLVCERLASLDPDLREVGIV